MPNQFYEGRCKVDSKKKDGSDLLIAKGDRKGEPFYKVSFQVDGEWINLMDFAGVTGGASGDYRVEYYQKFEPNGDPELYNDKPQYNLQSIEPLGENGSTPTSAAPGEAATAPYNPGLGAYQTALNCATQIHVALMARVKTLPEPYPLKPIIDTAKFFHLYLTTGEAEPFDFGDEDKEAAKEPDGSEGYDEDIPF
jgi:hypothetical protein